MLNGKVAIVTGGSRGIGIAIARQFASLGAEIAIIYAGNTEKAQAARDAIRQMGVRAECFLCDVSDFTQAQQTVDAVKEAFGSIDILVNNAGITRDGLILRMKETDFDDVLHINLKGAFNMIRHVSRIFVKQRGGVILNISSVSGMIGNAGQANYSASKAGVIGLTKSVARELAGRNIRCNAIAPGFVKTDMTQAIDDKNPLVAQIPLGRMGQPEDIAQAAAFLVQAEYITGEVLRVDGGLAI